MSRSLAALLSAAILCLAQSAQAAIKVGDKPPLAFRDASSGKEVTLDALKGKIVVVDFWATWCGPCMAQAEHMVKIHTTYGPKGLQMLGISQDQDQAKMLSVSKEKGFDWPQVMDTTGIGGQWGVTGIPSTFLIGPDGTVLWVGHPAQIDPQIEKAFRETPPTFVDPKMLADSLAALDKVETGLKEGSLASLAALAGIPAKAKQSPQFMERFTALERLLTEHADKALADIEPLITDKKFSEAASKLADLNRSLGNLPAGASIKKRLGELNANPEFKAQLEAATKAKASAEELAIAKRLQSEKKDEQAYIRFKGIVTSYAGTPSFDEAKSAVDKYEKDTAFMKRAADAQVATKAKAMIGMADNYRRAGKPDLAKKKYEEVIAQFPGTSFAEQAKKSMKELSN